MDVFWGREEEKFSSSRRLPLPPGPSVEEGHEGFGPPAGWVASERPRCTRASGRFRFWGSRRSFGGRGSFGEVLTRSMEDLGPDPEPYHGDPDPWDGRDDGDDLDPGERALLLQIYRELVSTVEGPVVPFPVELMADSSRRAEHAEPATVVQLDAFRARRAPTPDPGGDAGPDPAEGQGR